MTSSICAMPTLNLIPRQRQWTVHVSVLHDGPPIASSSQIAQPKILHFPPFDQVNMKADLREIYGASTRTGAEAAIDVFADFKTASRSSNASSPHRLIDLVTQSFRIAREDAGAGWRASEHRVTPRQLNTPQTETPHHLTRNVT
jgi:hypothetical protein